MVNTIYLYRRMADKLEIKLLLITTNKLRDLIGLSY